MKILFWDVLIILACVFYLACGFMTRWTVTSFSAVVDDVRHLEADPVMRQVVDYSYGILITQVLSICFFGGVYLLVRKKYVMLPSEANWQIVVFYSMALFLLFLHNIMNDLPIFLKLWGG